MKITNGQLFRAMKWLTENVPEMPDEWLDIMSRREIMNMYLMRSGTFTVEYGRGDHTARWTRSTYSEAVRRVAAVLSMAEELGGISYLSVTREQDHECVSREFNVPTWL